MLSFYHENVHIHDRWICLHVPEILLTAYSWISCGDVNIVRYDLYFPWTIHLIGGFVILGPIHRIHISKNLLRVLDSRGRRCLKHFSCQCCHWLFNSLLRGGSSWMWSQCLHGRGTGLGGLDSLLLMSLLWMLITLFTVLFGWGRYRSQCCVNGALWTHRWNSCGADNLADSTPIRRQDDPEQSRHCALTSMKTVPYSSLRMYGSDYDRIGWHWHMSCTHG